MYFDRLNTIVSILRRPLFVELDETLLKCENFRQFNFESSYRIYDKVTRIEIEACVFEPIWKTLQNRKDVHMII